MVANADDVADNMVRPMPTMRLTRPGRRRQCRRRRPQRRGCHQRTVITENAMKAGACRKTGARFHVYTPSIGSAVAPPGREKTMAKGQRKSNKEVRKPKADKGKKQNASNPSMKAGVVRGLDNFKNDRGPTTGRSHIDARPGPRFEPNLDARIDIDLIAVGGGKLGFGESGTRRPQCGRPGRRSAARWCVPPCRTAARHPGSLIVSASSR